MGNARVKKTKKRSFLSAMLCVLIPLSGIFQNTITVDAGNAKNMLQSITSTSLNNPVETEAHYVYDENDNKLMYNRVTGMVFSEAGIAYTNDSQPLTYDDKTEQFEDSLQRRLELVEKSTSGLQNYYLMSGEYKVRSIGIHDELYIVGIAANTAFNSGSAYDMLITRVYVQNPWYMWLIGQYGKYEYYDLYGHKIDGKYLQKTVRPNLITGAGTSLVRGTILTKFESWGTIKDLLDEIVYLTELVPPTGSPMGEFALNTVTGAFLRDDRSQKIRIKDNGQLIDPMGWPLIGSDARPLWWKEELKAYTTHSNELLEFSTDNSLIDIDGFISHSVISNVIAGQRIYLVYLADGTTLIPVTLKTISTSPYKAEYYDMNGNKIELNEIIEPEISVDDRKDNYPEEFLTLWEEFKAFVTAVWRFLQQWGLLILIGIIVLITLPFTLPILLILFRLLVNGLFILLKGILAIILLPIKLIKGRD